MNSVKLAQIVQTDISHITLSLVPGNSFVAQDGNIILNELKKRVGDDMQIDLKIVDEIKMTGNGKFKSVVSLV